VATTSAKAKQLETSSPLGVVRQGVPLGVGRETLGERPHRLGFVVGAGDGARPAGRAAALGAAKRVPGP